MTLAGRYEPEVYERLSSAGNGDDRSPAGGKAEGKKQNGESQITLRARERAAEAVVPS